MSPTIRENRWPLGRDKDLARWKLARHLSVALIAMLVLVSAQPLEVGAADEDTGYPEVEPLTMDEARRSDAEVYAHNHDVSVDEALRRLDQQFVLGDAINAVQGLIPERFAGGWIEHDPELAIEARFTGGPAGLSDAIAVLEATGVPVTVHTDAMHTFNELLSGQERATATIHRDYPDMGFYPDVRTGSVRLLGPDLISEEELKSLSDIAGVPVTLKRTAGPPERHHTYGGAKIDTVLGGCTTAFSSRDAVYGTLGVLTAGHCAGNVNSTATYYQPHSAMDYPMTMRGRRFDANQDFSWYSESTHVVQPYYWDGSAFREVWSTRARLDMVNYRVFKYGRSTGKSEGIVDSVWYNPGGGYCNYGPCDSVWGLIDDPLIECYDGDSGGPYFWAEQAWGIHSGGVSSGTGPGQCDYAIFMTIGGLNWDGVNTRVYLGTP